MSRRQRQPITPERLAALRSMPYAEYLRSPEWLRHRQVALKVMGYRCQLCNGAESLQVHHRDYSRLGCERMTDLIILCAECHKLFHERRRLVKSEVP